MSGTDQLGWWQAGEAKPMFGEQVIYSALQQVNASLFFIEADGEIGVAHGGVTSMETLASLGTPSEIGYPWIAFLPPLHPSSMGNVEFLKSYGLQYPYIMGAMANGITSTQMVESAGNAGMLAFFGAAGLSLPKIRDAILQLQASMKDKPFGFNLIHSPSDPDLELETVRLYLQNGIQLISASAFMDITLPLVYYRVKGLKKNSLNRIEPSQKIIAKVSREEVANKFFAAPPSKYIQQLLEAGWINEQEAQLAAAIPMADSLTAEADSGGHTDNRPALALLPTMLAIRNRAKAEFAETDSLYVGLGGGDRHT